MKKFNLGMNIFMFLAIPLFFSCQNSEKLWYINFKNANTRDNYQTVHRVKEVQQFSTGKGIKVGVMDKFFGVKKYPDFYAGGKDFVGDQDLFDNIDEHGYWLSTTLKELAPNISVYAIGVRSNDKKKEAEAFMKAIDWAIENKLDILTYSAEAISQEYKPIVDKAIDKAVNNGIVTIFLHNGHPLNILPYGFFSAEGEGYYRNPDIHVYHFDYNLLLINSYKLYLKADRKPKSGDALPYLSLSSTPIVVAASIAILKEINPNLTPAVYKEIIMKSSKSFNYQGKTIEGVLDYLSAIEMIKLLK
jgi:hypothetical protein